jgi:small-conductance mechanosensitive channel
MIPRGAQREDTGNRRRRLTDRALVKVVVAVMPEAVQTPSQQRRARSPSQWLTLNTDGQPHTMLNLVTLFTLVVGVVAFVLGLMVSMHFAAAVAGIIGFAVGMIAQLNSATRNERILIVTGIIASFVGLALGIAHGGFS